MLFFCLFFSFLLHSHSELVPFNSGSRSDFFSFFLQQKQQQQQQKQRHETHLEL